MRIAFVDYVCDPAKPGLTGLSDLVWDMASRLARGGDEIHVVAPYTNDAAPDPAVHVHRFPIPAIGYRNIVGHLLIVYAAYRRLQQLGRVDVVHVPEYVSAAMLGTLIRDTPVVFTEPGNIYERAPRGDERRDGTLVGVDRRERGPHLPRPPRHRHAPVPEGRRRESAARDPF